MIRQKFQLEENVKKSLTTLVMFVFMLCFYADQVKAADTCGGESSPGNIYACCNPPYPGGNCTWKAWQMMHDLWGYPATNWGNANNWANSARASGLQVVTNIPSVGTIGVSSYGTYGHVAYVTQVNNDGSVLVTEQNCGSNYTQTGVYHSATFFDRGYIYPNLYPGSPYINNIYPATPSHSSSPITLTVYGPTQGTVTAVRVNFPGGGYAILTGSQIWGQAPTQYNLTITFGTAGTWSIQEVIGNGAVSNTYTFTVL